MTECVPKLAQSLRPGDRVLMTTADLGEELLTVVAIDKDVEVVHRPVLYFTLRNRKGVEVRRKYYPNRPLRLVVDG